MKKLLMLVGGLGVVLVGLIVVTVMSINPLIEKAVNTVGPNVLDTEVTLGKADVSFMSGKGSLSDLFVGSPSGFTAPHTMKLGTLRVELDTNSLTTDTVVINRIVIENPDLTYEKKGGTDNFNALLNNVKKSVGGVGGGQQGADTQSGQGDEAGPGRKVIIKDLFITGAKVNVALAALGGEGMTLDLPEIHLTNIGEDKGGASPAEALERVLGALNGSIATSITGAISNVTKQIEENVKSIGEGLKDPGKTLEDTTEGIKKLFQ